MSSEFTTDYIIAESDSNVIGETKGTKHIIWFSKVGDTLIVSNLYAGEVLTRMARKTRTPGKGVVLTRPGSYTGVIMNYDVTADVSSGIVTVGLGRVAGSTAIDTLSFANLVGTGYVDSQTQARNTDTFVAGYLIYVRVGSLGDLANLVVGVEIMYDD